MYETKLDKPEHQEYVEVPLERTFHIWQLSRKTAVLQSCDPDSLHGC